MGKSENFLSMLMNVPVPLFGTLEYLVQATLFSMHEYSMSFLAASQVSSFKERNFHYVQLDLVGICKYSTRICHFLTF